jgi:hypothetical protein
MPISPTIPKYWEEGAEEPEFMKKKKPEEQEEVEIAVEEPEYEDEEERLTKKLEELEMRAEEQKEKHEKKAKIRKLKRQIVKAEVKEKLEPVAPIGKEVAKTAKGFYKFGKKFMEASKERHAGEKATEGIVTGQRYDISSKDGMGLFDEQPVEPSLSTGEVQPTLGFGSKVDLNLKKTQSQVGMEIGKKTPFQYKKRGEGLGMTVKKGTQFEMGRKAGIAPISKKPGGVSSMIGKGQKFDMNWAGKKKYKMGRK